MYEQIPIEKIDPNTWNPNRMAPEVQAKLENGMQMVLDKVGKLPPIIVRHKPGVKGRFEIIDGFHRWSLLKKMKRPTVDGFILDVPDDMARVLTATLNYIKGEADPEKYPLLVVEAMKANPKMELDDLAKLLPETAETLEELILASEAAVDSLNAVLDSRGKEDSETEKEQDPDRWVNLNFAVPLEVAGLVEAELDRIAERLSGKNRRMRALEYMAVLSSQTPLDDLAKTVEDTESTRTEKAAPKSAGFESDVEEELTKVAKKPNTAPKKAKVKKAS